ncbi:clathrin adaptor, mu subunit [Hortaea werneckii]|nr:clathrin adaptor, mu subunit [Hortaea werneckii]
MLYSTLLLPTSFTMAWTLNGRLTFSVARETSSSVTEPAAALVALLPEMFPIGPPRAGSMPALPNVNESLRPNLHSGDCAGSRYEEVDIFNDIDKSLVLAVFDVVSSPAESTGGLHGDLAAVLECPLRLDTLGRNVHLQRLGLSILGIAKVQDLVKEFVDHDEVALNSFLIEPTKVALSQAYQLVEEFEDQGGVDIALGDADNVNVFVLDMAECGGSESQNGRANLSIGYDLDAEDVGETRAHVLAEGTHDEQLALLIEEQHAGEHGDGGASEDDWEGRSASELSLRDCVKPMDPKDTASPSTHSLSPTHH